MKFLIRLMLVCISVIWSTSTSYAVEVDFEVDVVGDVCFDGVDNDLDGLIDYPQDPDCLSPEGDSEGVYVPPPEPEPEPENSQGSSSGVGLFNDKDDSEIPEDFFVEENIPFTSEDVFENIFNRFTDVAEKILQPISFTFSILDPRKHQEIVSEIPANDPGSPVVFREPVRFTLPEDGFEQRTKNQSESLVFQGPILVTFFDVTTTPVVSSSQSHQDTQTPVLAVFFVATLGLVLAFRFTIHEFSSAGVEQQIYHPCNQRIVFSVTSIVFAVCLVFLVQSMQHSQNIQIFGDQTLSFETSIVSNNKIEAHDLLLEFRVGGDTYSKEFVEVVNGQAFITHAIDSDVYQKEGDIEIFISRDAFNTFISKYTIEYSSLTHRQLMLRVLAVVVLGLIAELLELVWCLKRRED